MRLFKQYILIFACLVLASTRMSAQDIDVAEIEETEQDTLENEITKSDSIEISLLTCTPGEDVYAKFGHTALRVKNYSNGEDVVFNYGCFNYNSDNFLFKFLLGQTDYVLGAEYADYFMGRYQGMGNGVIEQSLNLSQEETTKLAMLLFENLRPENQEYRYKWIGNNCTDKARYIIEEAVDGKVLYDFSGAKEDPTVREILHECLKECPWVTLGVDLMLGHEIDKNAANGVDAEVQHKLNMFIPAVFMAEADKAVIEKSNGERIAYVKDKNLLFEPTFQEGKTTILTPAVVFCSLLIITLLISVADYKRKKKTLCLDVTLCAAQGLLGILIAFLFFFSEHPGVDTNWLVIVLNPLPLLYAAWMLYCYKKNKKNMFAVVNLSVNAAFVPIMILCPQHFNIAVYFMVFSLLIRSVVQTLVKK